MVLQRPHKSLTKTAKLLRPEGKRVIQKKDQGGTEKGASLNLAEWTGKRRKRAAHIQGGRGKGGEHICERSIEESQREVHGWE